MVVVTGAASGIGRSLTELLSSAGATVHALDFNEAARQKMLALGEAVPGVSQGSVRVSMEPAAIAVAFDPRSSSSASIAAALQKKLRLLKVSLVPLQAPSPSPSPSPAH